ncbi:hypothetical protein L228DRAFT_175727 [Xylona heveae TC161]|uniref:Uncharacterized protein n=1 Tax=Xylona heveae (strain CBS 132557 / TC161) TaxID=1328760 RepID=A0A165AKG0_XYLHT|nr:hypothetical protein L228DRAFT_175727 [Xylona heveae TC161]KZF20632.1 hypothetical protein L228DRAFT_175727 [Xylona heveae TC161]
MRSVTSVTSRHALAQLDPSCSSRLRRIRIHQGPGPHLTITSPGDARLLLLLLSPLSSSLPSLYWSLLRFSLTGSFVVLQLLSFLFKTSPSHDQQLVEKGHCQFPISSITKACPRPSLKQTPISPALPRRTVSPLSSPARLHGKKLSFRPLLGVSRFSTSTTLTTIDTSLMASAAQAIPGAGARQGYASQAANAGKLKLVNRLDESRSPYVSEAPAGVGLLM